MSAPILASATFAETVPQHHLLLIAAAVAATCGEGARIAGIEAAEAGPGRWVRRGRLAQQRSHELPGRVPLARYAPGQER